MFRWRNNEKSKYLPPKNTSKTTDSGSTAGANFYEYATSKDVQPSYGLSNRNVPSDKKPVLPDVSFNTVLSNYHNLISDRILFPCGCFDKVQSSKEKSPW